ncbi:PREDICTED: thioredoxin H2-like [Nelumbo nucifera]|uniref:Thioredoxin H2-like n=1 Tax=Nelumbo nucifera TaxID=4432 RepID=A0A1U7ZPT3_NELNU|nr:PREDICTED: thioredoxin H2-like [Nelumbo nucifera]
MGSSFSDMQDVFPAGNGGNSPLSSKASRIVAFHSTKRWKAHFDSCKNSTKLMVIYFTASWCGPCRSMEPALDEFAAKYTDDVEFVKIDVDELMGVSDEFGVHAMPTFILIKQGKEVDKVVGAKKDELEKKILKHRAQAHVQSY